MPSQGEFMDNIEKYYKDKLKISDDERGELFQDL